MLSLCLLQYRQLYQSENSGLEDKMNAFFSKLQKLFCKSVRSAKKQTGLYLHLMWSCPLIVAFWSSGQKEIENCGLQLFVLGCIDVVIHTKYIIDGSLKFLPVDVGVVFSSLFLFYLFCFLFFFGIIILGCVYWVHLVWQQCKLVVFVYKSALSDMQCCLQKLIIIKQKSAKL